MRATKKQAKPGASNAATNLSVAATPAQTVASPAASETPVNVVWHEVEEKDGVRFWAWSFVTVGFHKLHARATNLIFTIRAPQGASDKDFPQGMIGLLKVLQKEAQEGRPAIEGGTVELKGRLTGAAQHASSGSYIVWIKAQLPLPGVFLPQQRYLMGIFVHPLEFHVAKSHGVTRLSAMLGMAANYYPCPYWTDTTRAPVVAVPTASADAVAAQREFLQRSILNAFARARITQVRATLHQSPDDEKQSKKTDASRLVLTVPKSVGAEIKETIALQRQADEMYTLMVGVDASAEGQLVWTPTQADAPAPPRAITRRGAPGHVLAGSFVALLSKQAKDYVQVYEDGFMVSLTSAKYRTVIEALERCESVTVSTENMSFVVDFLVSEWVHPIDGSIVYSEEGFSKYEPPSDANGASSGEAVVLDSVALSTPDAVLKEALADGVGALSAYIASLQRAVKARLAPPACPACKLHIDVQLASSTPAPRIRVAAEPSSALSDELSAELRTSLAAVTAPPIRRDPVSAALGRKVEVSFLMSFSISPSPP